MQFFCFNKPGTIHFNVAHDSASYFDNFETKHWQNRHYLGMLLLFGENVSLRKSENTVNTRGARESCAVGKHVFALPVTCHVTRDETYRLVNISNTSGLGD